MLGGRLALLGLQRDRDLQPRADGHKGVAVPRESDNLIVMSAAKKISATEAARSFSDVVSRVRYRGEEFIVEKGGEAVCRISPVASSRVAKSTIGDFLRLLEELPPVDDEYRDTVRELTRKQGKMPRSPWES
jgi:antitoxin (DNA-binding transcriptional repressor) of toxin-antitoxin stability system